MDLSDEEFARLWVMGLTAERSIGKQKDWSGSDEGFEEFQYKCGNYVSGLEMGRTDQWKPCPCPHTVHRQFLGLLTPRLDKGSLPQECLGC